MATFNLANTEGERHTVDLKHATSVHVQPVTLDTPSLTPATTPEHNSPADEVMAGKKVFSLEKPTDKARELAAKLTLEEQVCIFCCVVSSAEELGPPRMGDALDA
jgi:beta-glucosidase